MSKLFSRFFSSRIDGETLFALQWKVPSEVHVRISPEPSGKYSATVNSENQYFKRPVVTQGDTGQELFEMINDAIFTVIDIPESYRAAIGRFLPPDNVREEMSVKIPEQYLNTDIVAVRV